MKKYLKVQWQTLPRKWRDGIQVTATVIVLFIFCVGFAALLIWSVESEDQAFKDDCIAMSGKVIELGDSLSCDVDGKVYKP